MKAIIYLSLIFLMASCSIQKRKYTNGWDVKWHTNHGMESSNQTKEKIYTEEVAANPAVKPITQEGLFERTDSIPTNEPLSTRQQENSEENKIQKDTNATYATKSERRKRKAEKMIKKYETVSEAKGIEVGQKMVEEKKKVLEKQSDADLLILIITLALLIFVVIPILVTGYILYVLFRNF